MRVQKLLAANVFCLLAMSWTACEKFEQTVGEYSRSEMAKPPDDEPRHPDGPATAGESGSDAVTTGDAGLIMPVVDEPAMSDPGPVGGAAGARSTFTRPPPMLLDAGVPPTQAGSPEACVFNLARAERRRLDMYLMVDNNSTLPASGAWEDVRVGLDQFVNDSRSKGVGVGVRYFGLGCMPAEYAKPDVDIGLLPNNATRITLSTTFRRWTASPMLPALEGAIQYQQGRAKDFPQWKQIVVLVSDALTQDFTCLYTPDAVTDAARKGYREQGIETYVIGVGVTTSISGTLDQLITRLGSYSTIAAAGGSGEAIVTPLNDDGREFSEGLHRVRRQATPCEFSEPTDVPNDKFGVAYVPKIEELPRYANARACGTDEGWYYAPDAAPFPVHLCPTSCDVLQSSDEQQIALVVPCENP